MTIELSREQMANIITAYEAGDHPSVTIKADSVFAPPREAELLKPRWLGLQAAKRYTDVSDTFLLQACKRGLIRSFIARVDEKGRGRRLLDRLSVDEWIEAGSPGWDEIADDFKTEQATRERRRWQRAVAKQAAINRAKWATDPQK